ncbi:MAG TPA: hypothetical protein VFW39_01730 [Sphingomicrobium sp.]|nr:hypothetical protein [Sphingomicrobium sp.]
MSLWARIEPWRASRTARALFWAAALFAFVMAVLPHPPHIPGNPNDKLQHIAAFVTLSLLGSFAYPATALIALLVRLSIFGAAIELIQAIPVLHRDSDFWDWVADTVAVGAALLIVRWWRTRPSA